MNATYIVAVQLTLWRDLRVPAPPISSLQPYSVVPCDQVSAAALGELHYNAYPPPLRLASIQAARDDMQAAFDGEYGVLIAEASLVVLVECEPVAVIQTVFRAPWEDVQAGPFIIELFVAPGYQRRGLGLYLLLNSIVVCRDWQERWLGLRVDSDNEPARQLYHSVGFVERTVA